MGFLLPGSLPFHFPGLYITASSALYSLVLFFFFGNRWLGFSFLLLALGGHKRIFYLSSFLLTIISFFSLRFMMPRVSIMVLVCFLFHV
jgi:hypothetical protein